MEYVSKGFRFDTEVMAWLDKLKAMHGSYNKGLRLMAFPDTARGGPPIETTTTVYDPKKAKSILIEKVPADAPERQLEPSASVVTPTARVKISKLRGATGATAIGHKPFKGPLLKPKDRK